MNSNHFLSASSRDQRRAEFGWCLYDWANSAFATVILAAVLPVYFASLVPADGAWFFWRSTPVTATAFWGYTVSASMVVVALIAPGLGNLADRRNWRRPLLIFFCLLGSAATSALFFTGPTDYLLVAILFILGNIGFAAGNVFYNAFLPGLAQGYEADRLSARGFAYGYVGGGLMLAIVFLLIQWHGAFGLPDMAMATRIGFLLTGIWWLGFSLPAFAWVRDQTSVATDIQPLHHPADYWRALRQLRRYPDLLRFLLAYLLYNDGIQTIIAVAAIFAKEELNLSTTTILGCFLMIQFVATPGSLLFARLAGRVGSKKAVLLSLAGFFAITVYASQMETATEFWILGFTVALVLGGSQALSRSLFASLLPKFRSAEFFSFYAISAKFASIFGPLLFALLIDLTGSSRIAIFALAVFFIAGIALLSGVNVERGRTAANS